MYRARITYCASIIANLYGEKYPYIVKDSQDTWIEVKSEDQAATIDLIDRHSRILYNLVKNLEEQLES